MSGDRLGHTPAPAAPTARHRQSSGQGTEALVAQLWEGVKVVEFDTLI